jgi:hypothetical protein
MLALAKNRLSCARPQLSERVLALADNRLPDPLAGNCPIAAASVRFPAMVRYSDDLALAHMLADTADAISVPRFRAQDLHVTAKPDLTPVTDADTTVEKALRSTLSRARPGDRVLGAD